MRRFWIFLYFLVLTTLALRQANIYAILISVIPFMIFYQLAERLDKEENP